MELLERAPQLEELDGLLAEASRGPGLLALVPGEAGMGKSVLVQQFSRTHAPKVKVVTGRCEPLSTPRPLGPLADIALQVGGDLALSMRSEERASAFNSFLSYLRSERRPLLVVLEDLHWADEATLDLLRFLTRRLSGTRALLLGTYRDDEVGPLHPLQVVLGDLATSRAIRRVHLTPFSAETVTVLARKRGLDGGELMRRTGGNPFFVTEVVAGGDGDIPATVSDAVLARAARLSAEARYSLEAAAVLGTPFDAGTLERLARCSAAAVEECLQNGLLQPRGREIEFRHELAREAIYAAVPPTRKAQLHADVLEQLREEEHPDFALLAHHAELCGDADAALDYSRLAAQHAASLGAHREAAQQYRRAVSFSSSLPVEERARLLELQANELHVTGAELESIELLQRAIKLWRRSGNRLREGAAISLLSNYLVGMGENADAERAIEGAVELLEGLPPGPELALAYALYAGLRMLDRDNREAIEWGEKAIDLATSVSDLRSLLVALNCTGAARLLLHDETGREYLERTLELARENGFDNMVSLAYGNLGSIAGEHYEFGRAIAYLEEGVAYARERDLDSSRLYHVAWLALAHLYLGHWNEATEAAQEVLAPPGVAVISRIMALVALGRVRARRGDPEVWPVLDEALELARKTETLQRLAPVVAARAEAYWLEGRHERCAEEARTVLPLALEHEHPWFAGELIYWLWKAGERVESPDWLARPFALQLAGRWEAASSEWSERDCPFEAARALAEGGEEEHLRLALHEFERLEARPAAAMASRRLRELGVRGIPRGPRRSTRGNPANLTNRELQVLALLVAGLSNGEIASRLHLSVKTVGHHVSSILGKLEVSNRTEAATAAVGRGIVGTGSGARG